MIERLYYLIDVAFFKLLTWAVQALSKIVKKILQLGRKIKSLYIAEVAKLENETEEEWQQRQW